MRIKPEDSPHHFTGHENEACDFCRRKLADKLHIAPRESTLAYYLAPDGILDVTVLDRFENEYFLNGEWKKGITQVWIRFQHGEYQYVDADSVFIDKEKLQQWKIEADRLSQQIIEGRRNLASLHT